MWAPQYIVFLDTLQLLLFGRLVGWTTLFGSWTLSAWTSYVIKPFKILAVTTVSYSLPTLGSVGMFVMASPLVNPLSPQPPQSLWFSLSSTTLRILFLQHHCIPSPSTTFRNLHAQGYEKLNLMRPSWKAGDSLFGIMSELWLGPVWSRGWASLHQSLKKPKTQEPLRDDHKGYPFFYPKIWFYMLESHPLSRE